MKRWKVLVSAALIALLALNVSYASVRDVDPVKIEVTAEQPSAFTLEHKEAYKVEKSEYKCAVAAFTAGSNGARLITFAALLGMVIAFWNMVRLNRTAVAAAIAIVLIGYQFDSNVQYAMLPLIPFYRDKEGGEGNGVGVTKAELAETLKELSKTNGAAIGVAVADAVKAATAGFMTKEGFDEALKLSGTSKENIDKLEKALKAQGVEMVSMKANYGGASKADWKGNISKAFADEKKQEAIMQTFKNGAGKVDIIGGPEEFANKVVGNITTANVTTDTGGNALLDLINAEDIAGMNLRDPWIESFATVTRTAKPVYSYADFIPGEGDAAFLAESAAKSQVDLDVAVRTIAPKKVAAYEIMSEEALTDIPRLDSEAKTLILKRVLLKRQSKILFGDGTADTPVGVASLARAFDAASWTGDKVTDVNLYDVIVALANQIYNTFNYTDEASYYPNLCVLNPAQLASLKLKKNEFGMYLFPQFQLVGSNGQSINVDGITVLPKRDIPAGKIMIGDFTKLRIINYIDYSLRMGFVNDQFIKNLFTMLGESRFYTLIKTLDRNAFIYDDIVDVVDGIKAV